MAMPWTVYLCLHLHTLTLDLHTVDTYSMLLLKDRITLPMKSLSSFGAPERLTEAQPIGRRRVLPVGRYET